MKNIAAKRRKNIYQDDKNYITAVSQNHKGDRLPNDVKMFFYKTSQTIIKLPKFTDKFYPELEPFAAISVSLKVITAELL